MKLNFLFKTYFCVCMCICVCLCVCVKVICVLLTMQAKRELNFLDLGFWVVIGHPTWVLGAKLGTLEERQDLVSAEPHVSP